MLQGVITCPSLVRGGLLLVLVATAPGRVPTVAAQPAAAEDMRVAGAARLLGASAAESDDVARVYRARAAATIWTTPQGTPAAAATAMTTRFEAAATHGLDPAAYLLPGVRDRAALAVERLAARDVALTLAALRYMRHLHLGRVDPRRLGLRLQTWAEPHDFPMLLADGLGAGRVPAAVDALAPPFAVYRALMAALARYRALAGETLPPVPALTRAIHAGDG